MCIACLQLSHAMHWIHLPNTTACSPSAWGYYNYLILLFHHTLTIRMPRNLRLSRRSRGTAAFFVLVAIIAAAVSAILPVNERCSCCRIACAQ